MGACQAGGSVIDWVMRTQGVSFRHAIEVLRAGAAPAITPADGDRRPPVAVDASCPPPLDATGRGPGGALPRWSTTTTPRCCDSPEALAYLARRKIDDPEVIDGSASASPTAPSATGCPKEPRPGMPSGAAWNASVCCASGHEHLAGSVIVPVTRPAGAVAELYGRKVGRSSGPAPRRISTCPVPTGGCGTRRV